MLGPRTSKLLLWIGYVCTVVVAVEVIFLGWQFLHGWVEQRRDAAEFLDQTRSHDGPLVAHGRYDLAADAIPLIALLPSRATFRNGGLRFAAMPGLGWHWYAISLLDNGEQIEGVVVTVQPRRAESDFKNSSIVRFTVLRTTYAGLMKTIDTITDGYAGDAKDMCLDGTEIAFERIRKEGITSGSGNACIDHYKHISSAVFDVVRQSVSLPFSPKDDSWYSLPQNK